MTASRSLANPLWKYGARGARLRSIGPLNRPMWLHLPSISARPGSVVLTTSPVVLFRSVYRGMSAVRRDASDTPMFSGATTEWLPPLGVLWQLVHVPTSTAGLPNAASSLMPDTPLIEILWVLKIAWPRAMARRASSRGALRPWAE